MSGAPLVVVHPDKQQLSDAAGARFLLALADALPATVRTAMDKLALHTALAEIWSVITAADRYFDAQKPWVLRKSDPARMAASLYVVAETLRAIAAARQASATMLAELAIVLEDDLSAHERAKADYLTARMRFAGLEKTERRHREAVIAEDLKTEQQALDELTGARTAREKGDE